MNIDADRPLVSVVTPSLDQAAFIEATMRSVLEQDYPRVEYLVLDGGSTDGSVAIIERYADRLAYWCSERDDGQSAAVNRGWAMARGDILAYLNSDDLYEPGALARAVRFFTEHPEVGVAYGACALFEPDGTTAVPEPPDFDLSRLLLGNYIAQPSTFLRRSVIEGVGALDVRLRYCMDYDLWVRAAVAGVVLRRIPGPPLARFRVWPGSKTSTAVEAGLEERLGILDRAFASSRLAGVPPGFRAYARARACMTVAYGELLNGDVRATRRYLARSLRYSWRIGRDPDFLRLWFGTALGPGAARVLRRLRVGARARQGGVAS